MGSRRRDGPTKNLSLSEINTLKQAEKLQKHLTPEELAINSQKRKIILNCINLLSPQQKKVMTFYYQGKKPKEIMDLLSLKESNLFQIIGNGKKNLRKLLKERGIIDMS